MGARVRRLILAARRGPAVRAGRAGRGFLRTQAAARPGRHPQPAARRRKATEANPGALRRLVIARDRHCAFPAAASRPAACQVHHLRPRGRQ